MRVVYIDYKGPDSIKGIYFLFRRISSLESIRTYYYSLTDESYLKLVLREKSLAIAIKSPSLSDFKILTYFVWTDTNNQ